MSLRERLRRRGNGGQATGDGISGGSGSSVTAKLADGATPDRLGADASRALEVVVPIELGAELVLAAAAANPVAGRATYGPVGRAPVSPSSVGVSRLDLHRRLIGRLDLEALGTIADERQLSEHVREAVTELLEEENIPLSPSERDELVDDIVYDVAGLGPIEPFVRDPTVTEIIVNGAKDVCIERSGRRSRVDTSFRNDAHLLTVIDRLVSRAGRRVDDASPTVDARLPDGSRVHAIVPPLALDGPVLSIRRPGSNLDIESLTAAGTLNAAMATLLAGCVRARLNLLISGGVASGKTTLMNALGAFIPAAERVVTIEHAAELRLKRDDVVRLEARPTSVGGRGRATARDLVQHAMRLRPSRIIIGDLQGDEALDVLQAMHTGCEGSMATMYANSPRDALCRLENMILLAQPGLPARLVRDQIAATVGVIVQLEHHSDGRRRVTSITKVLGVDGDAIATTEVSTASDADSLGADALFDGQDRTGATDDVEGMRAQVVAARHELDALHVEVRAAHHEAEEQRELQAMLQHRTRSLAIAVLGFVEVLDELIDAPEPTADEALHVRHQRLRDGAGRLLALFGLSEIAGVGGAVDETQHEIVQRVPSRDHAPGTVVAIVRRGFLYHGQPVRRAQVLAAE